MSEWIGAMKEVVASSNQLSTWSLGIAAGTALAILSTSYRRPTKLAWRLPYLIFLPGWLYLARSMYLGKKIDGIYLAALHGPLERHKAAALYMNEVYASQQDTLTVALVLFGFWLFAYVLMWTFFDVFQSKEEKK